MINIDTTMYLDKVEECKSSTGKKYKKVKLTSSVGGALTCIFEEDKVYYEIIQGERRRVTIVSRLYNGKEKVFVNIKGIVQPDNEVPFEGSEGASDWVDVDSAPAFKDIKKGK